MNLTPSVSLTFNGTCEAAFQHYERLLGGKIEFVLTWGKSPMAEQVPPEWREKILFARLTVGTMKIAAGDVLADAYLPRSGFQLMLSVENRAAGERLFPPWPNRGTCGFLSRRRSGHHGMVRLRTDLAFHGRSAVGEINRPSEPFPT
jgi:PhnB protein